MAVKTCLITIAHNVRHFRQTHGINQEEMAEKAGLSLRLFQKIEHGTGNPTVSSLQALAYAMKINVSDLLHLGIIEIRRSEKDFLDLLKARFAKAPYAVGVRTLDGVILWGNAKAAKMMGRDSYDAPVDLLTSLSPIAREILRAQLEYERRGIAKPYTNMSVSSETGQPRPRRYYPTLVYPRRGSKCLFSVCYIVDQRDDKEEGYYYEYCATLLKCIEDESQDGRGGKDKSGLARPEDAQIL